MTRARDTADILTGLEDNVQEFLPDLIPSFIDLSTFVSVHAHPGESVVFSGEDWQTVLPTETQRRKNWRILMEACLKANGGSGAYNGAGWYTTNEIGLRSNGGEVFIGGALVFEPYADGQYAPFFATPDTTQLGFSTRGWTFPAGVTIRGNGGAYGYNNSGSYMKWKGSRLIGYGAPAASFYGGAAPLGTSIGRHMCYWGLKDIGLAAIGPTAATCPNRVFHAANHYDQTYAAITSVNSFWRIENVFIDLVPGTSAGAQVGALIQCGLDCEVPSLTIMGHGNPGWGLVQMGTYNGSTPVAPSSTIRYGQLVIGSTKRGALFSHTNIFADIINLEPYGNANSKQQLVIGDDVQFGRIGTLWMEACYKPDSATATGTDKGLVVVGANDGEWNPGYGINTYTKPGPLRIGVAFLSGYAGDKPDYAITGNSCQNFHLGELVAANFTNAVIHIAPGTVSVANDPAYFKGSYDSSKAAWGGAPAFLDDDTNYTYNGFAISSPFVDRALAFAGAAPTKPNRSGSHNSSAVLGEKVWHSAPVAGGPAGWVCTTGGDYGTAVYSPFGSSWLEGSTTFNPSSLADGAGQTTTVTVTGAALGDFVLVSFSLDLQGITATGYVSSANTVSVRFQNETGGGSPIDLSSGTLRARVFKA